MKIKTPTYFAPISFGAGGCYGTADSADGAVKNACKEARIFAKGFGGFAPGATLTINVYSIRHGCYAFWDERGVFEVDRDTDTIVAFAEISDRYEDVNPQKPLTSARRGKPENAYMKGGLEQLRDRNALGDTPIGSSVA